MEKTVNLAAVDSKLIINKIDKKIIYEIIDNDIFPQMSMQNLTHYNRGVTWKQEQTGYVISYETDSQLKDLFNLFNVNSKAKKYIKYILEKNNEVSIYLSRRGF